jgi:16S rRNA (cytidine1402-2'-O)-methyltransferase
MAKLYLVPTPIGNLEDITLRSIRILQETALIFAEDTRVTKRLLQHLNIQKPLQPFHAHNEHKTLRNAIEKIKAADNTVLVSDAGTPGISDPGYLLIRACIRENIPVECLPGPTAFVPALVASGFPCDKFVYEGFLPHKKGRQTLLKNIEAEVKTTVLYESPHRLLKCLSQIEEIMGPEREICVARELTKLFEEYKRGPVSEVREYYDAHPPKGEIVIVISGKQA